MRESLPDVLTDEGVHSMFLTGFVLILFCMVIALVGISVARERARRAGIYRKYVMENDRSDRRRNSHRI